METVIINTRDKMTVKVPLEDILGMEDFMIKNMLEDVNDSSDIEINEDYDIIKCIIDSMRYRKLIFSKDTNLRLMYSVCNKWCCPEWLTSAIDDEVNSSPQLKQINNFIDNLSNNIYKCSVCGVGFNKYNNKHNSCKTHRYKGTIAGSNVYACCNKEEPCMVGYHTIDMTDINSLIYRLQPIMSNIIKN